MTPVAEKPKRTRTPRARKTTPAKPRVVRGAPQTFLSTAPAKPKVTKRTYLAAVGRRKSAIARVRLTVGAAGTFLINGQPLEQYFPVFFDQQLVVEPLTVTSRAVDGAFSIKVFGGGTHGQAEACRLGVARALVLAKPDLRQSLKHAGLLRRDPRVKERKKYGLKRARRAPQWQKR